MVREVGRGTMTDGGFNLGAAMAGGNASAKREKPDNEFYATPVEAVDALMHSREGGSIRRYWKIWEPCCGTGSVGKALEFYKLKIHASDLVDRGYGMASLDFLQYQGAPPSKAIITNPPFSLAEAFLLQARSLGVEYVAFLLKSTFWHAGDRGRLWKIWQPSIVYPLTFRLDFLNLGRPTMECSWFIWDVRHTGPETFYRRMDAAPMRGQLNLLGNDR
jgi:hypothetical protein